MLNLYNKITDLLILGKLIFNDYNVLLAIELIILFLVFYGWIKEGSRSFGKVKRGQESWNNLYLAYGIILVIINQIIDTSDEFKGYKVAIMLFNSIAILYLCFYNSWFRNKLIGFFIKSKDKEEF